MSCFSNAMNQANSPATETLELAVCIQSLSAEGEWVSRNHMIRLNPRTEWRFPALPRDPATELPPMLLVDIHLLELADHVQQSQV